MKKSKPDPRQSHETVSGTATPAKTDPPKPATVKMTTIPESSTLKDVRKALAQVEEKRTDLTLAKAERQALEEASVALRKAERVLIRKMTQQSGDALKEQASQLLSIAKEMRERARKLSAAAKTLEKVNNTLRQALELMDKFI